MLTFSFISITAYIIAIYVLFGQLPSISQSYYELEKRFGKKWHYLFSLALALYAFPLMIAGLDLAQGSPFQFLMFLAPAGIMFTAAAPQFKETLTDRVHFIGAGFGVINGLLAIILIFQFKLVFVCVTGALLIVSLLPIKTKLFWIEVGAIYTIHAVLIYASL